MTFLERTLEEKRASDFMNVTIAAKLSSTNFTNLKIDRPEVAEELVQHFTGEDLFAVTIKYDFLEISGSHVSGAKFTRKELDSVERPDKPYVYDWTPIEIFKWDYILKKDNPDRGFL